MFNVMFDQDLTTATFNPYTVNSKHAIFLDTEIRNWTIILVPDWHAITTVDCSMRYCLKYELKQWLKQTCNKDWRYWVDRDQQFNKQLGFAFKDKNTAMLFRLTWC